MHRADMPNPPHAHDPEDALYRCQALRAFVMAGIAKWQRRSRTRRHLRLLGKRELDDIGLSAEGRRRESAKWFWQR
jgi:uncharacterized protein YjiS (DUF1127 family)